MKLIIRIALIVLCLILAGIGLHIDSKNFTINILNSAISIILTVAVIDWLLERQRRQQWAKVRSQIFSALTWHIGNIAHEYMIVFRSSGFDLMTYTEDIGTGYEKPSSRTANALFSMVEMMENHPNPNDANILGKRAYSTIKWDLEQIRDSLLPRVLAIETDEIDLVSSMGNIDNASRRWVNEIVIDQEIGIGHQYQEAIKTLKEIANLYKYLVDHVSS